MYEKGYYFLGRDMAQSNRSLSLEVSDKCTASISGSKRRASEQQAEGAASGKPVQKLGMEISPERTNFSECDSLCLLAYFSTLKMEVLRSSETWANFY
jgi:hypothetical protein